MWLQRLDSGVGFTISRGLGMAQANRFVSWLTGAKSGLAPTVCSAVVNRPQEW